MGEHVVWKMKLLLPFAAVVCGLLAVANATVVVTGGLGFIGSHVTEELLKDGHKVIIFDDKSNGNNMNKDAHWIFNDISTTDDFEKITEPVDYVIHLAAAISVAESMSDPGKYNRTNVDGSKIVFEWAVKNGVKRVVTASSAAVYGDTSPLPNTETAKYGGVSPYAFTKYEMEVIQRGMVAKGLKSTALRFFNVFGPRQDPKSPYSGVISIFMDRANKGTTMKIFGDGKASRDFIYVKDIAGALIKAMQTDNGGFENFNVCHGEEMTITELADSIVENFNSKSTIKYEDARAGDIVRSVCNPQKLNTVLGFKPKFSVKDGLAATQQWFADMSKPANTIKEL